jgi:hypothetical protein
MTDGRYVPSKRLRNWHRKSTAGRGMTSLRDFARAQDSAKDSGYETARDWLVSKGIRQ